MPHPLDVNYGKLKADLRTLPKTSKDFKLIEKYLKNTGSTHQKLQIEEIFEVDRHDHKDRFALHDAITNRKLLWHGTNVAVVVAILSSGLRIMPHSGGRVGRGIYFASENSKSAGYVGRAGKTGFMFLVEVALGKEHHINKDDSSLRAAPAGYECIIAQGHTEPDPAEDETLEFDGKEVVVPCGKVIPQPKWSTSSFSQSEYLIYKESQQRIRYMLRLKWP